jgi:MFS family permease
MFGLLIGSFFFGWLSDAVGRVPSLVAAGITLLLSQANQSAALIKNSMIILFINSLSYSNFECDK